MSSLFPDSSRRRIVSILHKTAVWLHVFVERCSVGFLAVCYVWTLLRERSLLAFWQTGSKNQVNVKHVSCKLLPLRLTRFGGYFSQSNLKHVYLLLQVSVLRMAILLLLVVAALGTICGAEVKWELLCLDDHLLASIENGSISVPMLLKGWSVAVQSIGSWNHSEALRLFTIFPQIGTYQHFVWFSDYLLSAYFWKEICEPLFRNLWLK